MKRKRKKRKGMVRPVVAAAAQRVDLDPDQVLHLVVAQVVQVVGLDLEVLAVLALQDQVVVHQLHQEGKKKNQINNKHLPQKEEKEPHHRNQQKFTLDVSLEMSIENILVKYFQHMEK